jgi:hypothetical protein
MTIQGVAGSDPGFAGSGVAGSGKSGPEKFADMLRGADSAAEAKKRVIEVGFAQYAREQHELKKLMRVLNTVHAESPPDIREQLDKIVDDLKRDPPKNVEEALGRIKKFIDAIPEDAPDNLKERMQATFRRIKDLMEQADEEEEERLEKLRRSGRLVVGIIG